MLSFDLFIDILLVFIPYFSKLTAIDVVQIWNTDHTNDLNDL